MDPELVGDIRFEAAATLFESERGTGWKQAGLACGCGRRSFHLIGWPRAVAGRGGLLWRTFSRVWREVRTAAKEGEAFESPFFLPLFAQCDACTRETCLLDDERVSGRLPTELRKRPRESYRCRVCRRGSVELGVAWSSDEGDRARSAVDVWVRCLACRRTARVAWSDNRPSPQEIRIDRLYGRR